MTKLLIALLLFASNPTMHFEGAISKAAKPIELLMSYKKVETKSNTYEKPETKIVPIEEPEIKEEPEYVLYNLSAYSNHFKSTGKRKGDKGYGITRSGRKTVEGVTIAADWSVLPNGALVWIEGVGERRVDDTGSKIVGNKIDVYFENEEDALEFGIKKSVKVKILSVPDKN